MALLEDVRAVLERNGYFVLPFGDVSLQFEDDTVLGLCVIFPSAEDIALGWQEQQSVFLKKAAKSLRHSGLKSWNVYSVFLTSGRASKDTANQLLRIEDNFEGTRKIAQCEVVSPADLTRALLPLLPIQNSVVLRQDEDVLNRLRGRVSAQAVSALNEYKSAEQLLAAFLSIE